MLVLRQAAGLVQTCRWRLRPSDVSDGQIKIELVELNLESKYDWIKVGP